MELIRNSALLVVALHCGLRIRQLWLVALPVLYDLG